MASKPSKPIEVLLQEKKIGEIVNPRLVQATPDISAGEAIERMQQTKSGYLVIAEKKKVVGIFTETDVVKNLLGKKADMKRPVRDFMTKDPFVLLLDDHVGKAIDIMGEHHFYHIPLVNEKQELVNVLSVRTLIRFLAEFYPTEIYNLPPDPDQVMQSQEGG